MTEEITGTEPNPLCEPLREWIDGTPPIAGSLIEVRERMDALDDAMMAILYERATLAVGAAVFKQNIAEVQAPARQEAVINQAVKRAEEVASDLLGFQDLVEAIWKVLVPGCVAMQHTAFAGTRLIEGSGDERSRQDAAN